MARITVNNYLTGDEYPINMFNGPISDLSIPRYSIFHECVTVKADYLRDKIKQVIFNDPATIIIWQDGTKTVTKCHPDDSYDKEKGLMACIIKYLTGNTGRWNEILKDWIDYEADERKRLSTSQWEQKEPKG